MHDVDFSTMPVGEHDDGSRIEVCPKCGRRGRVQPRLGGGRLYDHFARALEPPVAGVHVDIVEWCEVVETTGLAGRSRVD